jgi:hypothetical protein
VYLFPRNKIIEIPNNDFSFFPNSPKEGGNGEIFIFNEDKMCFVDKVIV